MIDGETVSIAEMECYVAAAILVMEQYGGVPLDWEGETEGEPTGAYVRGQALSMAVNYRVMERRAEEEGLSLTDEEHQRIDERLQADIAGMGEAEYRRRLAEEGFTESFHRYHTYEIPYLQDKLWSGLFGEGASLYPDDDAVRAHYRARYRNAVFLLLFDADGSEALLTRARAGEDFAVLAEDFMDTLLTYDAVGSPVGPGQMDDAFQTALEALDENEVSGLVENSLGFYLIKRLPDDPDYCEENMESIRYTYSWELFAERMQSWEQEADVKIKDVFASLDMKKFA